MAKLEHFHHLHAHPELSFEEYETSTYIKNTLTSLGIGLQEGIHGTSVVGILDSGKPGPTIAFRADIDALPIQEETALEYKSLVPGVMHACGHDSHTATLLTFAKLLADHPELVKGKGGHGSSPHEAVNPVPVACMLASAINQMLAEKASPLEKAVFTVSYIRGRDKAGSAGDRSYRIYMDGR